METYRLAVARVCGRNNDPDAEGINRQCNAAKQRKQDRPALVAGVHLDRPHRAQVIREPQDSMYPARRPSRLTVINRPLVARDLASRLARPAASNVSPAAARTEDMFRQSNSTHSPTGAYAVEVLLVGQHIRGAG